MHPRATLAATILGSSLAFIDGSVVNVALPALAHDLNFVQVFLARDCAFDQSHINTVGKDLGINQGAIDKLRHFGEPHQAQVHVEK